MRRLYKNRGFSARATNIVLQSWRQSSQKQYDAHIRKWLFFCTKRQADPICPTISMAVDFLTSLYDEGMSYSSINSVRCALSAILESPASAYSTFGEHPDVKRFMKGIFQSRPPLPRNTPIPEKTGSCMQARLNSPSATNMADEISEESGKDWNVCQFRAPCQEQIGTLSNRRFR